MYYAILVRLYITIFIITNYITIINIYVGIIGGLTCLYTFIHVCTCYNCLLCVPLDVFIKYLSALFYMQLLARYNYDFNLVV